MIARSMVVQSLMDTKIIFSFDKNSLNQFKRTNLYVHEIIRKAELIRQCKRISTETEKVSSKRSCPSRHNRFPAYQLFGPHLYNTLSTYLRIPLVRLELLFFAMLCQQKIFVFCLNGDIVSENFAIEC